MINIILYILLGLLAGGMSGLVGIGGGVIIVPALVFLFGFSQHEAQGTTLALLVLPIGFLAAWSYFQNGFVDVKVALLIGIGFFVGGLIGGRYAVYLPETTIRRIFGIFLLIIALKTLFTK